MMDRWNWLADVGPASRLAGHRDPEKWYVATMDRGIHAGPFDTKHRAIINTGSERSFTRRPYGTYDDGRYTVGRLRELLANGFTFESEE